MDKTTLLAESIKQRDAAIGEVNEAARNLVSAAEPFLRRDAKAILEAEEDELVSLAADIVEARSRLKAANDTVKRLSRS